MSNATHDWRSDVLALMLAIARRRLLVLSVMIGAVAVGVVSGYRAQPFYSASATFVLLPREKPILDLTVQSASVETSEDAAKRSSSATLTLPPNPDLYSTLIRSSDITEQVAERVAANSSFEGARLPGPSAIRAGLTVTSTDEGVVRIAMEHSNPVLAAFVVNEVIRECETASKEIERQLIVQQAGFLSTAIERAEVSLQQAVTRRNSLVERIGVGDPTAAAARSASLLQTLQDTEARIAREMERMLLHRTALDPKVAALDAELRQVREKIIEVRGAFCGTLSEAEFAELECEWRGLEQDLMLRRDLLMSMRARHEVFRIRADQPAGNIAVIRNATAPMIPAGPSKRNLLAFALLGGIVIACGLCVILDQASRAARSPELREPISALLACFTSLRPMGKGGES